MIHASLSSAAWSEFVTRHWDCECPCVLLNALGGPPLSEAELMTVLRRVGARFRSGGSTEGTLVCVDHAALVVGIGEHLPSDDDASLPDYAARVGRAFGGRGFALITHAPHLESFALWDAARTFVRGLAAATSLADDVLDTEIFVGDYRVTPQGIHLDAANNFSFVLHGNKRMLLWPGEAFADVPTRRSPRTTGGSPYLDELDIAARRADALVLEGGPGDVLFWPASYWHVGESTGELVATLNVSVFRRQLPQLLARSLAADPQWWRRGDELAALERLGDAGARVEASLALLSGDDPGAAVRRWLTRFWLDRATGDRFGAVPPALPPGPLSVRQVVRPVPRALVESAEVPGGHLVSTNGLSFELPGPWSPTPTLARLRAPTPTPIGEFLREFPDVPVAALRGLLAGLLARRAIEHVE